MGERRLGGMKRRKDGRGKEIKRRKKAGERR
jgi:hypothetical protein